MFVSNAFLSILFIARPKTAIDLPDFSPASAIIFNLPRFDAKDVTITLPLLSLIILVIGSIVGVQVGQKVGQYLNSSHLKTLFAMLLCAVAIAIAYDTFFFEGVREIKETEIINVENLNFFSKFISKLSDNNPLLYGSLAILLAIVLGIIGAGSRQLLSKYKYIFLIKKN